jgi:DNA-directed RNA polymerase subunit K/omega
VFINTNKIHDFRISSESSSLDRLLPHVDGGLFCLVRLAMVRASEIHSGSPALVNCHGLSSDKSTTIAMEEIAQGKIGFLNKSVVKKY